MPNPRQIRELHQKLQERLALLGDAWVPKHERLLGVPPPQPAEAFSSWVWRIAASQRISLQAVLDCLGVESPPFWVDSGHAPLDLDGLAGTVMMPASSLEGFGWAASSALARDEFACLTTDPLQGRAVFRYCEHCLREDAQPHIRRLWRLAHAHLCPTHGTLLRDHCPKCHGRLDLGRSPRQTSNSLRYCLHCGADMCQVESHRLPEHLHFQVLAHQMEMLRLISACGSPVSESHWAPATPVTPLQTTGGVVDLSAPGNAAILFRELMAGYFSKIPSPSEESERLDALRACLRYWPTSASPSADPPLAMGIDLMKSFTWKETNEFRKRVNLCQDLPAGTFYWLYERYMPRHKPKLRRVRFSRQKLLDAAIEWIRTLGPSKIPLRNPDQPQAAAS